ncbi:MAG TPA: CAP domain-containing protein [Defluviitaleaceae bacterium]|nr:SH3 domain-containing protein [Candidatus Epulonipiscium sp.]HOQ17723.1 CAP domain-containing protein [Defluviitaleaceae bacterium]HQD49963.1 CAP domain-containing protein [Defluviitaleaceae bacterium]
MKKAFRLLFPVFLVIILYMISLSSVFADIKKHSTFAQATVKQAEITAFLLNVRTGPDTSYPVISRLRKGQIVNVLGKLNDWYVVHLPDDSVGVISSKYTKPYSYNENVLNNIENNQIVTTSSNDTVSIQEKEKIMLEYINNERKKVGLSPYILDDTLSKIASIKAKDMAENKYFGHVSPTYGSPFEMMKQFGISYKIAGENIAGNNSVKNAHDSFMNNPGNKANILSKNYEKIGIGIAEDERYGYVYVQIFMK